MRVLSPREWGALVDYDRWNDPYTPDDGIALHHGGGDPYPAGQAPFSIEKEMAQLRAWERYHLGKGWRGLAYGWGVGQTGTIYRARGFNTYGAHTGDVDGDGIANNSEIVPIIFIGSGHHHTLTVEAKQAIEYVRREIILPRAPKAVWLYGHQELKGTVTSCPGPKLMTYVRENRRLQEGVPTVSWKLGDPPPTNEAEARAVFEYMGPAIFKLADFDYDENDPKWLDERYKVIIARIGVVAMEMRAQLEAQIQSLASRIAVLESRPATQPGTVDVTARAELQALRDEMAALDETLAKVGQLLAA